MAYRGVSHDGVDRSPGQNVLDDAGLLRDRVYQASFDQAVLDTPSRGESQHRGSPSRHLLWSHDLFGRVVWRDGVDRTFGQNNPYGFYWSWIARFLGRAQGLPEEHPPALWLDPQYCRWCRSPMPPHDSDHMFCAECRRWYDDAYCYWCWDPAGDWYPGWPDYHLALCDRCSRRYLDALGPPWYPNHEQRCHLLVRWLFEVQAQDTVGMPGVLALSRAGGTGYELPREVCDHVAVFLAQSWRP